MKLTTRKYVAFTMFFLIICFVAVSIFGIHSRFGDNVSNHFKGLENIKFGQDFENHTEMILKTSNSKLKLNNRNIIETINDRLQNLGFTDNKIAVNSNNDRLILKFTQPAGVAEFDPQTIENLVCLKGELSIYSSNKNDKNSIKLSNADIKNAEIITQQQNMRKFKPKYGVKIKLNRNGTKKLATLTQQMAFENEKIKKDKSAKKKNPQTPSKLSIFLDQTDITKNPNDNNSMNFNSGLEISEPITNGEIEIFNDSNLFDLKLLTSILNEKALPDFLYMEKLQRVSPNLGMWFKRTILFSILIIIAVIAIILIIKFKLIGIVCTACLMGHFCFIIAGFSGFFTIYPGSIFNFATLIGAALSALIGIKTCFLIGQYTKNNLSLENNQKFASNIKNDVNKSLTIINMWNQILALSSLVLMSVFSYKTNAVTLILKPIYTLMGINLVYSSALASLAYAIFIGCIGAFLFENLILKFIINSITSQKIDFKPALTHLSSLKNLFKKAFKSVKKPKLKLKNKKILKKQKSKIEE